MIITFGRQHGSNGRDIAKELSRQLGIPCYDKEIVDEAASNSNFSREIFNSYDEKRVSPYIVSTPHYSTFNEAFHLNLQVVSEKGDCIFVGRCADYILRNREDLVKVFIYADYAFRVKTIMKRKDLSEEKARKLIREVDKDRGSYYKYYTDQVWGEVNNYDLCIDSGKIGVPGTVEVLKTYLNSLSQN